MVVSTLTHIAAELKHPTMTAFNSKTESPFQTGNRFASCRRFLHMDPTGFGTCRDLDLSLLQIGNGGSVWPATAFIVVCIWLFGLLMCCFILGKWVFRVSWRSPTQTCFEVPIMEAGPPLVNIKQRIFSSRLRSEILQQRKKSNLRP